MARDFVPNNFMTLGTPASLNLNSVNFTVAFKIDRDGNFYLGSWVGAGSFQWLISETGTGTIYQINGGGALLLGASISTTGWHTFGLSHDQGANTAVMYIDGAVTDSDTASDIGATFAGLEIGRAAAAVFSDAKFAEYCMWVGSGAILTAAEHMAFHKGANPQTIRRNTLKCYLPMWGSGSPERDYSGNANHGTISGSLPAFEHPPMMPHVVPVGGVQHNPGVSITSDEASVYLNLEALVTEEYPVVPFDLTASGTEVIEKLDAATIPLLMSVVGGECYSTWSASNIGSGESALRWFSSLDETRWGAGDDDLRWTEASITVEGIEC